MGTSVGYYFLLLLLLFYSVNCKSKDHTTDIKCDSSSSCKQIIDSVCVNNTCQCKPGYYTYNNGDISICQLCPDFGQYCGDVQCCRDSAFLTCKNELCRCRNTYSGLYCWDSDASGTDRFELLAQFVLGIGLMFALAILATLIWRFCTRPDLMQHTTLQREPSVSSLNSIQRLVLSRLRDRPPPYNPGYQPWKLYRSSDNDDNRNFPPEAPPPYTISSNQVPVTSTNQGVDNPVFCSEENMQDVAAALPIALPLNDNNIDDIRSKQLPLNNFTETSMNHQLDQHNSQSDPNHNIYVNISTDDNNKSSNTKFNKDI